MLEESRSPRLKSHRKDLSHEFGFPGISHLNQPILKLAWPSLLVIHNSWYLKKDTCIWRSGYKNAKQKFNKKIASTETIHTCDELQDIHFMQTTNIFQPVKCGANMIENKDVYAII